MISLSGALVILVLRLVVSSISAGSSSSADGSLFSIGGSLSGPFFVGGSLGDLLFSMAGLLFLLLVAIVLSSFLVSLCSLDWGTVTFVGLFALWPPVVVVIVPWSLGVSHSQRWRSP